ncbi:MAG: AAA family ATPase [Candidatus Nezhaarchaeales archaeon]
MVLSFIKDLGVLNHAFIPPRLLCRDREYERLLVELKLVGEGFPPPNFIVLGPSGSGKTVTVRKVLSDVDVPSLYTVSEPSAYGTLVALHTMLTGKRKWGLSFGALWGEMEDSLPGRCVIVIDEAEKFMVRDEKSDELLYMVTNRPNTGLILISNKMNLHDYVKDVRVKSRFNPQLLLFPPYKSEEIYMIVRDRLAMTLREGVPVESFTNEESLRLLSALAAQKGGDARYAIDLLREAVKMCVVNGDRLKVDYIYEARKRVERAYVEEGLKGLSTAHKLMLLAALRSETVGEAYRNFYEVARSYGFPELSERRLKDVLGELELMGYINVKRMGRNYRIEPSKWLPFDTVDALNKELSA